MKIYELSKELGKSNKELIAILNEKGMDVKSHFSSITDEQANSVRKMFSEGSKSEETKSEESKSDNKSEPHKKKYTAVFRPQNAQQHSTKPAQTTAKQSGTRVLSVLSANDKKQSVSEEVKEVQAKAPVEEKKEKAVTESEDKAPESTETKTEENKN